MGGILGGYGIRMKRPGLKKGTKIAVAMSGGLDSSAAVLLLKEAGYQPVGVTLLFWVDPLTRGSGDDLGDARRVAADLGIAHQVIDMKDAFYEQVVSHFLLEYQGGRTPNPCLFCNRYLKFGLLLEKVRALGIDYLATGHYLRNTYNPDTGRFQLFRARDRSKDQSYMLYMLTQEQLPDLLFPLGDFTKGEMRSKVREAGLSVADKKDSQEICFIPDHDLRGFLKRYCPQPITPGGIFSTKGEKLGEHSGLSFYTIGQRSGLGLTSPHPLYVVGIDPGRNALIVGGKEDVFSGGLLAGNLNFISGKIPGKVQPIEVKIRYRAPSVSATLYPPQNGKARVIFAERQKAVTPGQAAVFYRGEELLGGGTILQSYPVS
jgi:tRNA-specific 2-thiouridylase